MKTGFILLYVLLSNFLCSQNPFLNTTWNTSKIIGTNHFGPGTDVDYDPITLDTLNRNYPYGNITTFTNDYQFTSHNQGWCGNECRTVVSGTYSVKGNTIEIFVQTISYHKFVTTNPKKK